MHSRVKAEIIALAEHTPHEEVCGFIYADQDGLKAMPCRNISTEPAADFAISREDHVRALEAGRIFGVFHSHPDDASFSPADLDFAEENLYPLYLYAVGSKEWSEYLPAAYLPPLTGRQWVLGTWDCFGLLRDYYREHFRHHMNDYDRDESFCHEPQGIILNSFEREGFVRLPVAQAAIHDTILFQTDKAIPQHFGILTGPQRMLHHRQGGLAGEEILTDRWLSRAICAFRLKNRPDSV